MSTLQDRLRELGEDLPRGWRADLARYCGVAAASVSDWTTGQTKKLRGDMLLKVAEFFKVNPRWLNDGKGPKYLKDNVEWSGSDNLEKTDHRGKVPLISWVTAGLLGEVADNFHPGEADEWIEIYDTRPGPSSFALRVTGDSMTSPFPGEISFPDGSVIVVNPDLSSDAGHFVVAKDVSTQKATFKKLVSDGGRWFLKPLNPAYPLVEIDDPAMRVIGRVTEYQIRGRV
ncbi:putative repressor protein C2 [Ostertagia ostertagi]